MFNFNVLCGFKLVRFYLNMNTFLNVSQSLMHVNVTLSVGVGILLILVKGNNYSDVELQNAVNNSAYSVETSISEC